MGIVYLSAKGRITHKPDLYTDECTSIDNQLGLGLALKPDSNRLVPPS